MKTENKIKQNPKSIKPLSGLNMKTKTVPPEDRIKILEKQLSWYKSFFENSSDAVFIIQPATWIILDANDYAAVLLNLQRTELIGKSLSQFSRIFKLLTKSDSPSVLSELTLETPGGEPLMVEVSARFVDSEGQKLIHAVVRDVSEQHSLTDKLVQADRLVLLGQLSACVAHELRNPLAAVVLNLQVLQRRIDKESSEYNFVYTALEGVDRIRRIIEVILNFSRPALPDVKEININKILPETLELVSTVLQRKEIRVELKLDESIPGAAVDEKQLQQVFINLITNAADAIKGKGKINIHTYREKSSVQDETEYVVTSISDTGVGIPPEDLTKIFNPFFTRKEDGIGLGLPITQRIIYQHNGIIDVESTVNKGTTFYVKLPVPKL
ncbi:MAG: ATP-binding protein [Bacteroidota bacterium]